MVVLSCGGQCKGVKSRCTEQGTRMRGGGKRSCAEREKESTDEGGKAALRLVPTALRDTAPCTGPRSTPSPCAPRCPRVLVNEMSYYW